jgi:hypothetical protein
MDVCRGVTPTSTPTCCGITCFMRRFWGLRPDCKSAIVGSTPTGASSILSPSEPARNAGGVNKKTPGPHGPAGFVLQMTLARMAAELGQNHGVDDVNDAIFRLDVGLHDL